MKISYNFNIDQLPINLGQLIEMKKEDKSDFSLLNQTTGQLVDLINGVGCHKIQRSGIEREPRIINYYYCCQDCSRWQKSVERRKRD